MSILIWTLARTGGTSLTAALRELCDKHPTVHEPLNPSGAWNSLYRERRDEDGSLSERIGTHLVGRPFLKHCVEIAPFRVTEALADAAIGGGYRHIVLIRRNETARMMSWLFMATTGAASRQQLEAMDAREIEVRLSRLTKAHFVRAAQLSKTGIERLSRLKALLERRRQGHLVVAYEDIFLAETKGTENPAFLAILRYLAIDAPVVGSDPRMAALRRWLVDENQRSERYYSIMTRHFARAPTFENSLPFEAGEYDSPARP